MARRHDGYHPRHLIEENEVLSRVLDEIGKGTFSDGDQDRFRPLLDDLYYHDYFMIAADFSSYMASQRDVGAAFRDDRRWFSSAVLNTANTGWFSSDRAVRSYDQEIWRSKPTLHFECIT
jgi:starch phosphorylase